MGKWGHDLSHHSAKFPGMYIALGLLCACVLAFQVAGELPPLGSRSTEQRMRRYALA